MKNSFPVSCCLILGTCTFGNGNVLYNGFMNPVMSGYYPNGFNNFYPMQYPGPHSWPGFFGNNAYPGTTLLATTSQTTSSLPNGPVAMFEPSQQMPSAPAGQMFPPSTQNQPIPTSQQPVIQQSSTAIVTEAEDEPLNSGHYEYYQYGRDSQDYEKIRGIPVALPVREALPKRHLRPPFSVQKPPHFEYYQYARLEDEN